MSNKTTTRFACQSCDWIGPRSKLLPPQDIFQRADPGEPTPAGECPACGALCHGQQRPPSIATRQVKKAAVALRAYLPRGSRANEDKEAALTNLMTDLRYWARAHGLPFDVAVGRSARHAAAEGVCQ